MVSLATCSLTQRGFGIPKSELSQEVLDDIKKELTVTPLITIPNTMSSSSFTLYFESSKKLYIPKAYGLKKFGIPDRISLPEHHVINVEFNGHLRPEQADPIQKFLEAAHDPRKMGGILNVPCGGGKTVMGLYIICELRVKTLIIVHKEFLLQQWMDRIKEFIPSCRVGLIKGKVLDIDDKDIVLATVQTLSLKSYQEGTFASFGLVLIDEVHRTGTEIFSKALLKVNFLYALGLSATVVRKDGMTKVFTWFIGDIIHKQKRKSETVCVKLLQYYSETPEYCQEETISQGKLNLSKMLNNICNFKERSEFIVSHIMNLEPERRVLILSDRKCQLNYISTLLNKHDISYGFYIGGMKQDELKKSETKRVILATYSFASEGFDVKDLDTLVMASPKTDIEQSVGRILRQKEEERARVPLVLDIVDMFSIYKKQAEKRVKFYKRFHYDIEVEECQKVLFNQTDVSNMFGGKCII